MYTWTGNFDLRIWLKINEKFKIRQNEFIRSILSESLNKEEAMELFNLLDSNQDGNLTVKEISLLFGQDTKG